MKKTLFITASLLFQVYTWGQIGFSNLIDLGYPSASFYDVIIDQDFNLMVFGVVVNDLQPNQQGFLLAKFDTSGNLLNRYTYYDSTGDNYASNVSRSSFIKLRDESGYVIVGDLLNSSNGVILVLNNDGALRFSKEYSDENSIADFYENIIEVDDGFIISGTKQGADFGIYSFIMKTDYLGKIVWERKLSGQPRNWHLNSAFLDDKNTFVFGISSTPPFNTPLSQLNTQTIIIATDSLGVEKWRWESNISLEEGGAGSIQKTQAGNWIYLSGKITLNTNQNSWTVQPKVIQRDAAFDLLWEKTPGSSSSNQNRLSDLILDYESNWIAIGFIKNSFTPNTLSGWVNKFYNDSNSIWSRVDTVLYYNSAYTEHFLSAGATLPSGSIICCGLVNDFGPSNRSWGWLMKMNKDGCLDTIDCSVSEAKNINSEPLKSIKIYPNPFTSNFYLGIENVSQAENAEIIIYSIIGKPLFYQKVYLSTQNANHWVIDADSLNAGAYLLCIKTHKGARFFNLVKMN